jgi:outer membrane protein assembly factor BamA
MEEMKLIESLTERKVALQITFDLDKKPTVHSISLLGIQKTEGETLLEALQETEKLIFGGNE